ncbi:extracellular solute-binding protein [Micropruina sonneratiae]|uniref:ABC transporter substrate-binding protein n=1 Tax=Micropruina sonneratiae TaxID=2986940 RepID=UPI0022277C6C|nr:extracellular solute-binding protein [Micropruina sp. KQZ13P-5]MCW3159267.1 extracellular solute-binding protein [Micropruina sp. KQZ13P-5]
MRTTFIRTAVLPAALLALLATGCSQPAAAPSSPAASESAASTEPVTLTVATFNEFGYEDLFKEYTKLHPNVTITPKKAATSNEARENYFNKLAAGSGLSDIEAIEVDWLPDVMQTADKLTDLSGDDVANRWLDWKAAAATTPDGKLVGFGTDIGPEAVCYRSDLFKKAGLPTDRDEVAALLQGDWNKYFEVGKQFVAKSNGVAWFDSADAIMQGQINQLPNAFSSTEPEETLIPLDQNQPVKDMYTSILNVSTNDKLSAGLSQWSTDWVNAFQKSKFATMLCPGWMLGIIEGNAKGIEGWDIANVFPGGGGNWGGSYLTVPAQGKNTAAARELAAWLTAPEQQIKAFKAKGTFPSQKEALTSQDLLSVTNKFFNDAPTGQILADRANAVTVNPFKGPNYFAVRQVISDAINRVDVTKKQSADESWTQAVKEFEALG